MPAVFYFPSMFRKFLSVDALVAVGVAVVLCVVYALTASHTVMLEDDGLFILAALDAGVAHPPGYPLFVLLGHLFSWLPLGSPAFELHLLSGLFGALACGMLYQLGRQMDVPPWAAAVAALGWGVSEHFWSQAIITEVYTLNALLCIAVFYFCLRARGDGGALESRALNSAALCFGLGLANHWPLMVLALVGMSPLLWSRRRQLLGHLPRLALIALAIPVLLYGWMLWRSHQPVMAFYGPIEDFKSLWFFLSRQGYAEIDASPTAGAADALGYGWYVLGNLLTQLTPVGAALALIGIHAVWRRGRREIVLAGLGLIFAHSFALILLLDFDYEDLKIAVFRPYPITAFGLWALWMGCGLAVCVSWLRGGNRAWLGRIAVCSAVAIPIWLLAANLRVNDRSEDHFAHTHARTTLESLPPDSVFLVFGDVQTGPMGYARFVEKIRPDVEVLSTQGLVYPNRLFNPLESEQTRWAMLWEYIARTDRPVFITGKGPIEPLPAGYHLTDNGFYHGIEPTAQGGTMQLRFDRDIIDYLQTLTPYRHHPDGWIRHLCRKMLFRAGLWLGYLELPEVPDVQRQGVPLHDLVMNDFHGLLGMVETLLQYGGAKHLRQAEELVARAEPLLEERFGKERIGRFYYLKGFLAYRLGGMDEARRNFARSVRVHPHAENASFKALERMR